MDNSDVIVAPIKTEQSYYLRLKMGNQLILIALNQICTVLPILELQTIPHGDPTLAGMLNYHGNPVPVYHLTHLINAPPVEYDINALLLLSPLSTGLIGFLASEEIDIVNLSEEKIRKMHTPKNRPYVIGLVEDKKWSAWVLDLEQLLIFHQAEIEKFHA